jgi:hypothetical protein
MAEDIFEFLRRSPPRCLASFEAVLQNEFAEQHTRVAEFEVSCRRCKAAKFDLGILAKVWKKGTQTSEIGVIATCSECGNKETLFDGTRFGYDGEHGHLAFLKGDDVESPLAGGRAVRVRVEFVYNSEMNELSEHATAQNKSPQDFFDWLHILVDAPDAEDWSSVWEFECA